MNWQAFGKWMRRFSCSVSNTDICKWFGPVEGKFGQTDRMCVIPKLSRISADIAPGKLDIKVSHERRRTLIGCLLPKIELIVNDSVNFPTWLKGIVGPVVQNGILRWRDIVKVQTGDKIIKAE
jgi:hypothetical protein